MLVLTRKASEQIQIGEQVVITILRVKGQSVRIGIEAPREVRVMRAELPKKELGAADGEVVGTGTEGGAGNRSGSGGKSPVSVGIPRPSRKPAEFASPASDGPLADRIPRRSRAMNAMYAVKSDPGLRSAAVKGPRHVAGVLLSR